MTYRTIDPQDPLASLYDVDDGERVYQVYKQLESADDFIESTVVTFSDWNHKISPLAHPAGAGAPP